MSRSTKSLQRSIDKLEAKLSSSSLEPQELDRIIKELAELYFKVADKSVKNNTPSLISTNLKSFRAFMVETQSKLDLRNIYRKILQPLQRIILLFLILFICGTISFHVLIWLDEIIHPLINQAIDAIS